MIRISVEDVRLAARADGKEEAIRAVGRVLVERGYIAPGYVESMLGRELQANTYLGCGIAIPHGMGEHRELIRRTGVAVAQFPEGVEWGPGQRVHLVVGIAAKSDEHLGVLAALTDVLDDPGLAERLARTDDPDEVVAGLTRGGGDGGPAVAADEELPGALETEARILPGAGLHARPATRFVDVAARFRSEVRVRHGGRAANGKALASLLKLGVSGGETIRIAAAGPDAEAAVRALREAVEAGLGEEEAAHAEPPAAGLAWTPHPGARVLTGVPASPGIAIGPLLQFQETRIVVVDRPEGEPAAEKRRLAQALETAREQLAEIHDSVRERSGAGRRPSSARTRRCWRTRTCWPRCTPCSTGGTARRGPGGAPWRPAPPSCARCATSGWRRAPPTCTTWGGGCWRCWPGPSTASRTSPTSRWCWSPTT